MTSPEKKQRESNLELYRIIVMLMIVAHHYVVNSGLFQLIGESPLSAKSLAMLVFGGWGKTGINCFILITGWFMCRSEWSAKKLLKLYLQITFYALIIYGFFLLTGHERFTPYRTFLALWPVMSLKDNFVSCFLVWYLFIPFLNILLNTLTKRQFGWLTVLLLATYCFLPQIPKFNLAFNYVSWFTVLYFVAAYLRIYGLPFKISHKQWGFASLCLIIMGGGSIMLIEIVNKAYLDRSLFQYYLMQDSNRLLPFLISVSSFMWFKDVKIPYSKWINAIGGATFGVLLIHANSDAMRQWLWRETVDCMGHYDGPIPWVLGYAAISVLIIFAICAGIDWFRIRYLEPNYMKWFDRNIKLFQSIFKTAKEHR